MNEGLIPSRYAKALYKTALEKGCQQRLYELMKTLSASFDSSPELASTIANPFVAVADKAKLLDTAAGATPKDTLFDDFIKLLEHNKRIALTRATALAYQDIYRRENHIYRVHVTSAAPMDKAQDQRLRQLVASHLPQGSTMEYSTSIDPDLIGGFTVGIDSERLDASIKNELKQLRLKLLSK
ncbi:MAG: F0F1 ATP synthase subunit delta [Bacteroidales bacterium]|nr:F0F1 ATP synthase subunit delta [Bacteroidales bacterium]MCD8393724.1 F0F1 ATP synthase subunit delta [Bacteroidales bacterium]